ncbi:hypothetical protein HNY73_005184 [Argiope bruennichi]|uniref:Uncharacterized protein n=1 Tax=Argiope bruennichi TaxID=94029 RepID=A0A8T0FGK8_ARGBR|nr:hypothetical protein HNY73_005184 [Argiope bruennichi]
MHPNETRAEHPLHNIGDRLAGILGANRLSCDRRTIRKKSSNFWHETEQTGRLLTEFHSVGALRKSSATCWTALQEHEFCYFQVVFCLAKFDFISKLNPESNMGMGFPLPVRGRGPYKSNE